MNPEKTIQLIEKFNHLVMAEKTGKPNEFANKLGISERSLYRLIDCLKNQGVEISYSRKEQTYHFAKPTLLLDDLKNKNLSLVNDR